LSGKLKNTTKYSKPVLLTPRNSYGTFPQHELEPQQETETADTKNKYCYAHEQTQQSKAMKTTLKKIKFARVKQIKPASECFASI
jgi:hypothetical protein